MIDKITSIALEAGQKILEHYNQADKQIEIKYDKSPVTIADKLAHDVIVAGLSKVSNHPIISEEGHIDHKIRTESEFIWLVDPLDGTKDFIHKTDHFTVNIALIKNKKPILGVIYAPVFNEMYSAEVGKGCFKNGEPIHHTPNNVLKGVKSNFHSKPNLEDFYSRNKINNTIAMGSSLKFCRFAEGAIDVYARLAPTSEWDIAAGCVIAEEAGGEVLQYDNRQPVEFQKVDILNPSFVLCSKDRRWIP